MSSKTFNISKKSLWDIIKKSELYIELKRDKLVSWKINRYTGEGTRKVADLSWDYKCEKVDKLF